MQPYDKLIMEALKGETPKEKLVEWNEDYKY